MAIIEGLKQGSPAWHEYRRSHIMATDASIILDTNPWGNPIHLYEEKNQMRPPVAMNKKMERGQTLEPIAREIANKELGMEFTPCVFESEKYPWQAASLDGLSSCGKFILEIKCPNEETHTLAIDQHIPEYYLSQMQHQFAVTGCAKGYYFSYRPEYKIPFTIIEVLRDDEMIEYMTSKELRFYIDTCQMCPPTWKFKEKKSKKFA